MLVRTCTAWAMDGWLTKPAGACPAELLLIVHAVIIDFTVGCELTPASEPLLCSCGKHSARLQPQAKRKSKWEVFEVKKEGNKPRRGTTRAEKMDAMVADVITLCKGVYQKKNQPAKTTTAQGTHDLRHRDSSSTKYAESTSRSTRVPGPGRGKVDKRVSSMELDAVSEAHRVLKKSKPTDVEWRQALGRLTEEHISLRRSCDKVRIALH